MTNLIIHPEVGNDLLESRSYYERIDPELSLRFLDEVYAMIERAKESPLQYRKIYKDYRRVLCSHFPYKVFFEILESEQAVHIVAVRSQKEHPDKWKHRL